MLGPSIVLGVSLQPNGIYLIIPLSPPFPNTGRFRHPREVAPLMNDKRKHDLYTLIFDRTLASVMKDAKLERKVCCCFLGGGGFCIVFLYQIVSADHCFFWGGVCLIVLYQIILDHNPRALPPTRPHIPILIPAHAQTVSIAATNPSRPEMAAELVLTGQSVLVQVCREVCMYIWLGCLSSRPRMYS